jgi:hypothetical protein
MLLWFQRQEFDMRFCENRPYYLQQETEVSGQCRFLGAKLQGKDFPRNRGLMDSTEALNIGRGKVVLCFTI